MSTELGFPARSNATGGGSIEVGSEGGPCSAIMSWAVSPGKAATWVEPSPKTTATPTRMPKPDPSISTCRRLPISLSPPWQLPSGLLRRRPDFHDLSPVIPVHVRFKRIHLFATQRKWLTLVRDSDAPTHHFLHRGNLPDLRLELRVGLRMGDRPVRVTHIARLPVSAHRQVPTMPELIP